MDRFPTELLAQVCSLSDVRSLKKIRLVNATFAQIAAQYLFEGLYFTLIPKYLDKVSEVAFHPTLRFHVRTLYFDYNVLDENYSEYEVWKAKIDSGQPGTSTGEEIRAKAYALGRDLNHFHANFCRLLASQKALFDSRMDFAILSAALAMLPNLRAIESIVIPTPYHSIIGSEDSSDTVLSDLQMHTLLNPLVDPPLSTKTGRARPLASLLSGLGLTRKQILTMEIEDIAWSFWEQDGLSGFQHGAQQLIHAAFRHLEKLFVSFLVDAYDLEVRLQGLMPLSIANFIGAAQRLQSLELIFDCHKDEDRAHFDGTNRLAMFCPRAGQLFATLTLPNLAIFRLQACILTEGILIGFIRRHATTLKHIHINMVVLDNQSAESTSWEKTLKQIAPILVLDSVRLRHLWCDDIENVILAGDLDPQQYSSRLARYCQGLAEFLFNGGQTDCPKILDFARPAA